MNMTKLLILFLSLFLIACESKEPIPAQREKTVDMVITISSKNMGRGGWISYNYRIDGYTSYNIKTTAVNSDCPKLGIVTVGSRLVIPIPYYKSETYPTGYIDPPKDLCYIATIAKPYKETQ